MKYGTLATDGCENKQKKSTNSVIIDKTSAGNVNTINSYIIYMRLRISVVKNRQ